MRGTIRRIKKTHATCPMHAINGVVCMPLPHHTHTHTASLPLVCSTSRCFNGFVLVLPTPQQQTNPKSQSFCFFFLLLMKRRSFVGLGSSITTILLTRTRSHTHPHTRAIVRNICTASNHYVDHSAINPKYLPSLHKERSSHFTPAPWPSGTRRQGQVSALGEQPSMLLLPCFAHLILVLVLVPGCVLTLVPIHHRRQFLLVCFCDCAWLHLDVQVACTRARAMWNQN